MTCAIGLRTRYLLAELILESKQLYFQVLRELLQIASSSGSLNRESVANGFATVKKNEAAHQNKDVKTENGNVHPTKESMTQDNENDCK